MRIEDNRLSRKGVMFKDLEVGSVFEHVGLNNMIMIKLDEVTPLDEYGRGSYNSRNALRIDEADVTLNVHRTSTELWHIAPESMVIPLNVKMVIEE